ncbi:bifunctional 3'-5' exonuclease/DNA polymerase [Rhodococcus spelaei]|uniref:DNA-directed DNA polymerase n=1 Tax=Rhodococcus spelaei TaxID=2546320 RepID=A0A541BRH4_9NOCA|nr:bifunctional 3'-5' exonuclease/DNA polymerase [Rhodococcus spelaei]TQF74927.1 bifunctional 3'-5' exonuclease/DNA polymerase [Rhodococcus spelaei]
MRIVVAPGPERAVTIRTDDAGVALGSPQHFPDLPAAVRALEPEHPRWVWPDTAAVYPAVLRAGLRVQRCHDLALTAALLRTRAGEPPIDAPAPVDDRPGLFDTTPATDPSTVLAEHADQLGRIGPDGRLTLLVAAESAGALAAAEMGHVGMPFSAAAHHRLLESALGPRATGDTVPQRLREVADEVSAAFGRPVNPASHVELVAAFARDGIELTSTRAWLIRDVEHPAIEPLLRYRDLAKLHAANGWSWLDTWVRGDRFRPVYVPGGVVSGRWASRGGGALQIPKPLRTSVIADPGHTLVIADAGQLEPRILAAMSGDRLMVAAAGADDLYAPVATEVFDGDRAKAKVAILGVLYGATAGEARALLTLLRRRFPTAVQFVENAARAGERGEVVHSWLGRACPPPDERWWSTGDAHGPSDGDARARGRFTRNFVVQATAAEWALCLLADLRRRLADEEGAELVFFQHDEVVVHCRDARSATRHVLDATAAATRLLFGDTDVRFPMDIAARDCYADP